MHFLMRLLMSSLMRLFNASFCPKASLGLLCSWVHGPALLSRVQGQAQGQVGSVLGAPVDNLLHSINASFINASSFNASFVNASLFNASFINASFIFNASFDASFLMRLLLIPRRQGACQKFLTRIWFLTRFDTI